MPLGMSESKEFDLYKMVKPKSKIGLFYLLIRLKPI